MTRNRGTNTAPAQIEQLEGKKISSTYFFLAAPRSWATPERAATAPIQGQCPGKEVLCVNFKWVGCQPAAPFFPLCEWELPCGRTVRASLSSEGKSHTGASRRETGGQLH